MANTHHAKPASTSPGTPADTRHNVLGEIDQPPMLFAVFGGIIVLFLATVFISKSGVMGPYALFVQLAIGTMQAGLVAYYFMHLRQGDRVVILTALSSVFWLGILFVLFMSDYMTRHRVMGW